MLTAARAADDPPPPAARTYTNADLERLAPRRGETGVLSVPAPAAGDLEEPRARAADKAARRGEPWWRREAERVRERALGFRDKAADLRRSADARPRKPSARLDPDPGATALRARAEALERRASALEEDLLDRARREGALPGWLR